jgi:hypothetical protein
MDASFKLRKIEMELKRHKFKLEFPTKRLKFK